MREVYGRAHAADPPGPLPAAFWQDVAFGPDVDLRASLVLCDRVGPAAIALLHAGPAAHTWELGLRGVAARRLAEADRLLGRLTDAQLLAARRQGCALVVAEVDDCDDFLMATLGRCRFTLGPPACTWRREGRMAGR